MTDRRTAQGPIVMVDDSEADLELAKICYSRSDVELEFLPLDCGRDLLDHIERAVAGEIDPPILILLDVNMPGMDGFEVLRAVRGISDLERAPRVVMLSHSDNPCDIQRATEEGADGYCTKPTSFHDYISFFNSLELGA